MAEHLQGELAEWGITVPTYTNYVYWNGEKILVSREASREECRRILERVIKKAQTKYELEHQERLL